MGNWQGRAAAYRDSFAALCAGTIDAVLGALPTGSLLDAGCGTGDLAVEAARRGFEVTAVDAEQEMVALTAERLGAATQCALPQLPFADGGFRAVAANFVINHVPDPRAAVAELARVLAPAGRAAFTIWPDGGAGWSTLIGEVFAAAGVATDAGGRLPGQLDFPRIVDGLSALVRGAGLEVVVAREVRWVWRVRPANLWAGIAGQVATVGRRYAEQPVAIRDRIAEEYRIRARRQAIDGWLELPSRAVLVVGSRHHG